MTFVQGDASHHALSQIGQARASGAGSVETFDTLDQVAPVWLALQERGVATPYQTLHWMRAWTEALCVSSRIEPLLVVCKNMRGTPVALFPLGIEQSRGARVARFLGGKHANMNMPVLDGLGSRALTAVDLKSAFSSVARQHRIDLFRFESQPSSWGRLGNPMALLPRQPSPSSAWRTSLLQDADELFECVLSSEGRKKLRQKEKKLALLGAVSIAQPRSIADVEEILSAFLTQKAARFQSMGVTDPFASPDVQRFLINGAANGLASGEPAISLYALRAGSRIVAVFGGSIHGGRFTGMFTSFDPDPAVARYSPGDILLNRLVRIMCERELQTFDLGTGDAAYKNTYCQTEEPLFDSLLPMTMTGHIHSAALSAALAAKRNIKRSRLAPALLHMRSRLKGG
jgi:CelD/BcsL family acetyltransferase involved in cellulose biosynthesis